MDLFICYANALALLLLTNCKNCFRLTLPNSGLKLLQVFKTQQHYHKN